MTTTPKAAGSVPDELLAALENAERVLDPRRAPDAAQIEHLPDGTSALDQVWNAVRAGARGERSSLSGSGDLLSLAVRAKDVEDRVRRDEDLRRSTALSSVRTALGCFQSTRSVPELISAAPAAVCELGFDRAIFSRIYEAMWVTETVHVGGDENWAHEILEAGREHPEALTPKLHETEIVRRRRAIVVRDVQENPRVHQAVAQSSKSATYVAAPVMPKNQVIGFLHADRYFHPGPLAELDRELLSVFSDGFGYALERAILLDKLAQLRESLVEHTEGFPASIRETAHAAPRACPRTESSLTRREAEILSYMADGQTNGRIAARLVISEGTVKSHVKHILRKLGAANRAEAVSIWLTRRR
ncbi:helix-turn-helix transcriptional regulator [Amycolatopsis circi]|uniref:helix-turn-helix transcriptional regulator n=1 Tax=Amycolatopsis circi TaxID=871959 RepID=UPI0013BE9677|nr:helix-turn-helix transcriptional regulator [Amycolatopsis circi]